MRRAQIFIGLCVVCLLATTAYAWFTTRRTAQQQAVIWIDRERVQGSGFRVQ